MADVLKFGSKAKSNGAGISPALRDFLDAVIVPLLVRKALAEIQRENAVESGPRIVKDCALQEDCTGGVQ
jgi:hypothetical protein